MEENLNQEVEEVIENEDANSETETLDEVITETEPEEQKSDEKYVPLGTHLETKKQVKELKKQIRELQEKTLSSDIISYKEAIKKKYLEKGYDEDFADIQAELMAENKAELLKSTKKSDDEIILEDIKDLVELGYKDALEHKTKIIDLIKKGKRLGEEIEAEDAYFIATKNNKSKLRESEIKTQAEQLQANKRRQVESRVVANSSPSSKSNNTLDADDSRELERLQKIFPSQNWDAKKLLDYKNKYPNLFR